MDPMFREVMEAGNETDKADGAGGGGDAVCQL